MSYAFPPGDGGKLGRSAAMITRRQVIKLFGVAGGAAFFPPLATEGIDFTFFNSSKLAKFIQPLALPAVLRPSGLLDGAPHYTVRMVE